MEFREFEVRETDPEKREVVGLAVPYGETIDVGGFRERFEKGAISGDVDAQLFYGHDHRVGGLPIGRITEGRDTDGGYEVRAVISKTPKGDEVYTLLRDGVLKKFSIGFEPVEHRMDDDVLVRTSIRLREVSVVAHPAYSGASVSEVRSETTNTEGKSPVTENVTEAADLNELRDTVADLERRIALVNERDNAPAMPQFRSAGEMLKALATGDASAKSLLRDFGTTVEADVTRPGWLSEPLKLKTERRPTVNLFSQRPLPASGNSVEYPFVLSTTGTVDEQVNEGDTLDYMEVALDTATSPVKTYGGYISLSRQAIERSDLAYLDASVRFMASQYTKATEARVRSVLTGATGTNTATLAADTAVGWIDLVVDSMGEIEDNSVDARGEFMIVSRDVFKRIAHIVDDAGRPIFALREGGVNVVGTANVMSSVANVAGMPVIVNPALAANTCWVGASDAIVTLESPGAPFRLADENILNLTKDFSLYGYLAAYVSDAKALVKCDVDLVP